MYAKWWAAALVLTAACTKKNPGHCAGDSDCSGATPFCDVDGAYDESDHTPNTCTVVPAECPLERCGCTPGAVVSCDGDQLATCAADGKTTTASSCTFGCANGEVRCLGFEPLNNLGDELRLAKGRPAIAIPNGSSIDTDSGAITDGAGAPIVATTNTVVAGGTMIRVFSGSSIAIGGVTIRGTLPVASSAMAR